MKTAQLSNFQQPQTDSSAQDDARYQRALDELFGSLNYERTPDAARSLQDFRLNAMRTLLQDLGNPQEQLPTVHVAGSKGKGSTATMIARIVEAAGFRVGLFTSPHVDRFEERFTVNGMAPSRKQVADLFDRLREVIRQRRLQNPEFAPTFFEMSTALGWMSFLEQKVDLAVMEVGLGGRLDSTNVCKPSVTVITSISRDHTRLLGDTLSAIAREKAGIIKPGVPVVTHLTDAGAAQVTEEIARERGAPHYRLGHEFRHVPHEQTGIVQTAPACYSFDFHGLKTDWTDLALSMPGEHQTRNAALAVAVSRLLAGQGWNIPEAAVRQGLKNACCPLRVEVLRRDPLLIVDAAHNPASIAALCETLKTVKAKRKIAIFGSSRDKETDVLLSLLNESMDELWLTRFTNNPRAVELPELQRLAEKLLTRPFQLFPTIREALSAVQAEASPEDLICVTGSFFLAAEAKAILLKQD